MRIVPRKTRERGRGNRLTYRLDRFLGFNPAAQILAVIAGSFVLALVFAGILAAMGGTEGDANEVWWAVTRMLDGGTVAADTGPTRRGLGILVTLVGLLVVAVLTGAFASTFADRLRAFRAGTVPIFERGHVLFVGWSGRGEIVLRELAKSGLAVTIVILADAEREAVEERVREALSEIRHRLSIIVRRGDPTTTSGLARAAAKTAHAVVVLPEPERRAGRTNSAESADRDLLRSLMALRRVIGARHVPTVVEVSSPHGRELVRLAPGGAEIAVVDAHAVSAHLLVHAARQPSAFEVLRVVLSLDARSVYLHKPETLAGKTFDAAHAAIDPGILVGVLRDKEVILCPARDQDIRPSDRLLVLADDEAALRMRGSLPAPTSSPVTAHPPPRAISVLVVRYKPELPALVRRFREHGAARVSVLAASCDGDAAKRALAASEPPGAGELFVGDSVDEAALSRALRDPPDVLLLLAPDVPATQAAEADADQLITLLEVQRLCGAKAPRAVVEVHSAETENLVPAGTAADFVLSSEAVGMLLAQEIHAICREERSGAWIGAVYHDMLEQMIGAMALRQVSELVPGQARPTFATVAAAARAAGEVAIGIAVPSDGVRLNPPRQERFDASASVVLVGNRT